MFKNVTFKLFLSLDGIDLGSILKPFLRGDNFFFA